MVNLLYMPDSRFIDAISVRPFRPSPSWALSSSRTTRPSVSYPAFHSDNAISFILNYVCLCSCARARVLVLACLCPCACARRACTVMCLCLIACLCFLVSFCARPVRPVPTDFPSCVPSCSAVVCFCCRRAVLLCRFVLVLCLCCACVDVCLCFVCAVVCWFLACLLVRLFGLVCLWHAGVGCIGGLI